LTDRTLAYRAALGLALLAYAVYPFNFSGLISSWDGEFAYATTQNLVQHGEFSASQMWWNGARQQVLALNAELSARTQVTSNRRRHDKSGLNTSYPL